MWLLILFMLVFIVLDKTKVLQYNTLFMSVVYIVGIPFIICIYASLLISDFIKLIADFSLIRCMILAVGFMAALPLVIMMFYVLFKICRNPIDRSRFSGTDEEYGIACMKRQRTLMWVCYPLTWIFLAAALGTGIYLLVIIAGLSLVTFNPAFWLLVLLTFGAALAIYVVLAVGVSSVYLTIFLIVSAAAFMFVIITIAMTVTVLYRMRGRTGYSKLKYVLTAISMLVPVWSLVSIISVSQKIREISRLNQQSSLEIKS